MRYVSVMLVVVGALCQSFALAQPYPNKPVRVIVPVPAGGTPDITARLVMPVLSEQLKQPFIVDNRPGAGSLIGTDIAAKAQPDGYTLLFSSGGPLTILPHLQKKMPYQPLRDLAPISLISSGPFVLITHPSSPFKTIGAHNDTHAGHNETPDQRSSAYIGHEGEAHQTKGEKFRRPKSKGKIGQSGRTQHQSHNSKGAGNKGAESCNPEGWPGSPLLGHLMAIKTRNDGGHLSRHIQQNGGG